MKILGRVPEDGIAAVAEACTEALAAGIAGGDVVMAILARRRQPPLPAGITTPLCFAGFYALDLRRVILILGPTGAPSSHRDLATSFAGARVDWAADLQAAVGPSSGMP